MTTALRRGWQAVRMQRTRLTSLAIACAAAVIMVAVWWSAPALLKRGDLALYDHHFLLRGVRPGNEAIVIVAIDEKSLAEIGRWPWPRNVLARLVERLSAAGAAAVGVDVILNEPEVSGELRAARALRQRLGPDADPRTLREIDAVARGADHDRQLADAIRTNGHVVLPSWFQLAPTPPDRAPERQGQPLKSAILSARGYDDRGLFPPLNATAAGLPIPPLLDAARSLGHVNMQADVDGVTRWEVLVVEHGGYYYPSLALETVRVAAGLEPFAVRMAFADGVDFADLTIPTDYRTRMFIDYAGPTRTFTHIPAADVIAGRVAPERLRDRIVFVGATAEGTYDLRVTPFSPVLPGVEKHANVAADIVERRFIVRTIWFEVIEAVSIVLLPVLLGVLLPMLRPMRSVALTLALQAAIVLGAHLAFRRGMWLPLAYPTVAVGLTFTAVTVYRFLTEERQRRWTKHAFQQYVSPEVVERIVRDHSALQFGGEVRNLTVLFTDIRGFTTFSERHEPSEVVAQLREHLTRLTECVLSEGGTLDKYIGDATMAIFGAPVPQPDHALRACRAALRMSAAADELNARWQAEGKDPLRIGVGVNSGDMVVGNLGSEQVFSYTVTGDAVNLAARVESLNKDYPTAHAVIVTESTYEAAGEAVEGRPLGEVKVKGKTRPVTIYELLAVKAVPPTP